MPRNLMFVSESACRTVLDVADVAEQIERVFHWEAANQVMYSDPRVLQMEFQHNPNGREPGRFKTKAAILPELGIAGFRLVGVRYQADGSGPGSPDATRLVVLMDLDTATPLAVVDEHYNFSLRTAASVAVAAKKFTPERPRLGLAGVGAVGSAAARIFPHLFPLESVHVTSRRAESREPFAEELQKELPVPVVVTDSIEPLIDECNILVLATTVHKPLVRMSDVKPGTVICALGKYELEPEIYRSADKFVVDDWRQTARAEDIAPWIAEGRLSQDDLYAEMVDVVVGNKPGRERSDEVVVIRTEGMGSQDIALAHRAYVRATEQGLAVPL